MSHSNMPQNKWYSC